jgi:ubiquitin-conjugating enzyme E2 C
MSGENRRPTNGSQIDPNPNESGKTAATKRLQKELMDLVMNSDKSITAFPDGDNLFRYYSVINNNDITFYY